MLQPKRTKFRKQFKGRIHGVAKGGTELNFGEFGLKALEPERVIMKLTAEGATTFAMCVSATAAVLQRAVDRGLLPDAPDLLTRAELLCRIVHSLILAPYCAGEFHNDEDLAAFARVYLIPLVKG